MSQHVSVGKVKTCYKDIRKVRSIIPANYNEPVEILLPVPADKFLYHKADKNYFVHFTALQKPICEFS